MTYIVELDREEDGRSIAEISSLPGVVAYGATCELAVSSAQALALRVIADRIDHGEETGAPLSFDFAVSAAE